MTLIRGGRNGSISVPVLLIGLLVIGCGSGDVSSETGTEDTEHIQPLDPVEFDRSPFLCELTTVIRNQQGTILGIVTGVESPLEGLPNGYPGRTHALVDVKVSQVVGLHRDHAELGNAMPEILPNSSVRLVVYHDNPGTPLNAIADLNGSDEEVLFILEALGDAANPEWQGVWGVRRVVEMVDGRASFQGACADELNPALQELGANLGRPADLDLVADFASEGLERYGDPSNHGPIESAARGGVVGGRSDLAR